MDAIDSNGLVMPISVWVKRLEQEAEPRALVVMEPVERTVAMVTFNAEVIKRDFSHLNKLKFTYLF